MAKGQEAKGQKASVPQRKYTAKKWLVTRILELLSLLLGPLLPKPDTMDGTDATAPKFLDSFLGDTTILYSFKMGTFSIATRL